jgi:hypothetical protein
MLWWQPSTTSLIEANASKKIDAYPNPASNYIYFSNLLPQHKIYFFDAMGRQVIFFNEPSEIDITSLSNGIYFVKIFDGQDKVVGSTKILKQ